jgi:hypothetical protein
MPRPRVKLPSFLACDDALVGVAFALAVALVLFVIDVVLL